GNAAMTVRSLHSRRLVIDGTQQAADAPIQMVLTPGSHTIQADGGDNLSFRVAADGTVWYDAALEGALTGLGTHDLTVQGREVSIDFSGLNTRSFWVDGVRTYGTSVFSAWLLPGRHTFWADAGSAFSFDLDSRGILSDPTG